MKQLDQGKKRATFGVNVESQEKKEELHAMLEKLPGKTDQDRLEYCLKLNDRGEPDRKAMMQIDETLDQVRKVISGMINENALFYQSAIAEKEAETTRLADRCEQMEREMNLLVKRELELQEKMEKLMESLREKEEAIRDKTAVIESLRAQVLNEREEEKEMMAMRKSMAQIQENIKLLLEQNAQRQTSFLPSVTN